MRSYHPEELFDENGRLIPELQELAPVGNRRMGSNPHANGGQVLRDLRLPDFRSYAVDVPSPGDRLGLDMHRLGKYRRRLGIRKMKTTPPNRLSWQPRPRSPRRRPLRRLKPPIPAVR